MRDKDTWDNIVTSNCEADNVKALEQKVNCCITIDSGGRTAAIAW